MNKEKLLSPAEAAYFLGKSIITLRRWDHQGILPAIRDSGNKHRRYKKNDLIVFLKKCKKPKLNHKYNTFIFDFDSTLFPHETLDEILKLTLKNDPKKDKKIKYIEDICRKGMEGKITLSESLNQRLNFAKLHKNDIQNYLNQCPSIEIEMQKCIHDLQKKGQSVFIISGGFSEWVVSLSQSTKIPTSQIFANQFIFNKNGYVTGFMTENPLCQNGGKPKLIQALRSSGMLQGDIIMIGDGASDLEVLTQGVADLFIGFSVYAQRQLVQNGTPYFFTKINEFNQFLKKLLS